MGKKKETKPDDEQVVDDVVEENDDNDGDDLQAELTKSQATADAFGKRLHTELVRGTGRLADPTDLAYDAAHLDDPEKMNAAISALLEAKPHLRARRIDGDAGQGKHGGNSVPTDFSMLFRS